MGAPEPMQPVANNPANAAAGMAFAAMSADLFSLLDATGRIVWVNPAFERASGRSTAQALGQPLAELLAAGNACEPWPAIAAALASGQSIERIEITWRHPSGDRRWGMLSAQRLDSVDAAATLAVCVQDISEQRRLEELLDMAQDFGRLGVWERKFPSGEGRWDQHVFRFFGMEPKDAAPAYAAAYERIHPDDRAGVNYPESTRHAGKYEARYRVQRPDGSMRHLHSQWEVKNSPEGVPERAIGIMVDDTETHELAQSFTEATEQLRLAVDLGNIAIWRQDLRTNRFQYNQRAYEVLEIPSRPEGHTLEEVRALIHPDDMPRVLAAADAALRSDRPVDMEARYRRADGSWRYVLTRRVLRRDAQGDPLEFLGVALDVTDQVEEARRAHELTQRMEIATRSAGLGVFTRDPESSEGEWNAEMFRIFGRSPDKGVPTREEWLEQIVHPEDRALMSEARDALLYSSSDKQELQYRVVCPNGEVRWLIDRVRREMRDGRTMLLGITIDVTDRVRTEAALRSATERVALAARSVGLGTWEWDPVSGDATWDDAMYRLRGREPHSNTPDAASRRAMTHPEDRDRVDALLDDAVEHDRSASYEFRVVWPDGSVRWLASRSTPVADAEGLCARHIGVNWDITDSVNAEAQRREKLLALRESEAKSQFLARMSHELRTPLNAVLGFAQLLQLDRAGSSPDQRNHVEHILSAGEHLLSLINEVLDLSSLESGQLKLELQPVSLAELVTETLPLVTSLASGFGVTVHCGALQGVARADRVRLRQVLINLLSNAIKYNRQGGTAHIETQVVGAQVCIRVDDTGRGLTEHQCSHLFEPFNRLGVEDPGIEGTGIGLAIVKTLVTRMGGSISVTSEPGAGSHFEVLLPRGDAGGEPATAPPPRALAARINGSGRLLYIEDNPVNVMLVEELVASRSGLSLVCEPDGERGVARALSMLPDIVLIDMQLPDIDGFEVLRRLRAAPELAGVPCLAVSANAMPEDISRALAAGFDQYWTKPLEFTAFLASLERLLSARPQRSAS